MSKPSCSYLGIFAVFDALVDRGVLTLCDVFCDFSGDLDSFLEISVDGSFGSLDRRRPKTQNYMRKAVAIDFPILGRVRLKNGHVNPWPDLGLPLAQSKSLIPPPISHFICDHISFGSVSACNVHRVQILRLT